ncbi:type VI secretion system baseplate subunit TssG [Pontibacter toksunensis]|uniref:Type VI secretion system baseplate subunit TssG n=1 Tax=Pontibacter toksunensis TaxID=1332631 RepID=A0ABW6BV80_9BACT
MEQDAFITQLQQEIKSNFSDIKAESLLAIATASGLTEDDFMIASDSLFSRAYSRDVLFSALEEDASKRIFLQLHLSRSGLYDALPEGVFHQPTKSSRSVANAATMAADHKMNKQKEREIRRFFMPFENAFFEQRMQLEIEETQLLEGLQSGILNEYFIKFWGVSPAIPPSLISPLIELLPYVHKIAGNLKITAQCLEKILQEKVSTQKVPVPATMAAPDYIFKLGGGQLGLDMVIGDQFKEDSPLVEFIIGPLQNSQIKDYLEGGNKDEFLKVFYSFFIPVEAEVITRIEVAKENESMVLAIEEEPVLGYSSVLL